MTLTLANVTSKLNWRLILIHLAATWFFYYAFQQFSYLYNIEYITIFRQPEEKEIYEALQQHGYTVSDITNHLLIYQASGLLGMLVAEIISLIIVLKSRWFWVNSVLVFLIMYAMGWFNITGWTILSRVFLKPGQLFDNITLEFLVNGIVLLLIGLFLFFSKTITKFIHQQRAVPDKIL